MKKKNILYIKNFEKGKNLTHIYSFIPKESINIKNILSTELIDLDSFHLNELIKPYDIIILGGGKQHLTTNDHKIKYPEILNQIEIVKLISTNYIESKILIGICLGCQIIALSYGHEIKSMNKFMIGFDYLDINTINYDYINHSNDKFLNKIDFNLLSKSFSFHYDYMNFNNFNNMFDINKSDNLIIIGKSIDNIPYIITNTNQNIYGFQFHPEICTESIYRIIDLFFDSNTSQLEYIKNTSKLNELQKIYRHFFLTFLN